MSKVTGKVAQIVGPVIDVEFGSESELPKIYDSLEIKRPDGSILVLEVQSHIGEDSVRTIAMDSSDGLSRGTEVVATGAPIQMPIGEEGDVPSIVSVTSEYEPPLPGKSMAISCYEECKDCALYLVAETSDSAEGCRALQCLWGGKCRAGSQTRVSRQLACETTEKG